MKILKGDLITYALGGRFNCIVHGCNCFNKFGKGIALSIRKIFPEAYVADLKTIEGDKNKLGTISYATVKGGGDNKLIVVNAGITHKITECQYCNSVIGINNIKVHEKSCKHNPDRVPGRLAGKKLNLKIGTCIYCGRTGPQHGITRHETSCLNNPNRLPGTSTGVNYTINSANCQYCNKHGSKSGITRHEKSCMENPNRTVRKNKPRINDK